MKHIRLFFISLLLAACSSHNYVPQDGDIFFCVAESSSEMSSAIVNATMSEETLQFDHVALFANINNQPSIIEASPNGGVKCISLEEFLSDANKINHLPAIVVKRVKDHADINATINRAQQFIGLPYDWSYFPDNNKLYCSELIYESFIDNKGNYIFTAKPMRFSDEKGNVLQFWIDLFQKLGEPIPEGVLGTNPNDMSQDHCLTEVHRYFSPTN